MPGAHRASPSVAVALPAITEALGSSPQVRPAAFNSLFSDTQGQPVSRFVQDLWTANPRVAAALTGQAGPPTGASEAPAISAVPSAPSAPAPSGPLSLFSDRPANVRALFGETS
jgi:hypothetical protein